MLSGTQNTDDVEDIPSVVEGGRAAYVTQGTVRTTRPVGLLQFLHHPRLRDDQADQCPPGVQGTSALVAFNYLLHICTCTCSQLTMCYLSRLTVMFIILLRFRRLPTVRSSVMEQTPATRGLGCQSVIPVQFLSLFRQVFIASTRKRNILQR